MFEEHENESYKNESIQLDGKSFKKCTFFRCRLQYAGQAAVKLANNSIEESSWEFIDAAQRTIGFMADLYRGGMKEVIEDTFENIRQGKPIIH